MPETNLETLIRREPEFASLTNEQCRTLISRFTYVLETCDKIEVLNETSDLLESLNEIELDTWANLGAPELDDEAGVSSWLVHSSWTRDLKTEAMFRLIRPDIRKHLAVLFDGESLPEATVWIQRQGCLIRDVVHRVLASQDYLDCVTHIVVLDILLLNLASAITRIRLLPSWSTAPDKDGRPDC